MKNIILLSAVALLITLASCQKTIDHTKTKVGFYLNDKGISFNEQTPYQLYIDDEYKGKIYALDYEPTDTDSKVLFYTLDSKKHEIDLKNEKGEYISTGYLQIETNKTACGAGYNKKKPVEGINGSTYNKKTENAYALYAFMKNK